MMIPRKFITELERMKLREGRNVTALERVHFILAYRLFVGKPAEIRTWLTMLIRERVLELRENGLLVLPSEGEILRKMKNGLDSRGK